MKIIYKQRLKKAPETLVNYSRYAKDLWNQSNYILLDEYNKTGKFPYSFSKGGKKPFEQMMHTIKNLDGEINFEKIPSCCAQSLTVLLFKAWKGYFASLKSYRQDKSKFKGTPQPPKFLPKNGRQVLEFTNFKFSDGDVVTLGRKEDGRFEIALKCNKEEMKNRIVSTCKSIKIVHRFDNEYEVLFVYDSPEVEESKKVDGRFMSIDLGVNNLAVCLVNNFGVRPLIVSGGIAKSTNQYYNKRIAELKSKLTKGRDVETNKKQGKLTSKQINIITNKRNRQMYDCMHKASKMIVDYAVENEVGKIFIGGNLGEMKHEIRLSKKSNQNIVQMPWATLVERIKYKAARHGIEVDNKVNEAYTSKIDHIVLEDMCHHEKYMGVRSSRGMFKSSSGIRINADVNGAIGIMRKALKDDTFLCDDSIQWKAIMNPLRVDVGEVVSNNN